MISILRVVSAQTLVAVAHRPWSDWRISGINDDLFAAQVGDLGNVWGGDGLPGRPDDAVEYLSPTLSGIGLDLVYVPDEGVHNQRGVEAPACFPSGWFTSSMLRS
jgi:hypothetical protein